MGVGVFRWVWKGSSIPFARAPEKGAYAKGIEELLGGHLPANYGLSDRCFYKVISPELRNLMRRLRLFMKLAFRKDGSLRWLYPTGGVRSDPCIFPPAD